MTNFIHLNLFAIILIFILSCNAFSQPIQDVVLKTDEDKIRFLLYLQQRYPGMFATAAQYEADLVSILDQQLEVEKNIEELPEFKKLMKEFRGDDSLNEIYAKAEGIIELTEKELVADRFEKYKAEMLSEFDSIPEDDFTNSLIKRLKNLFVKNANFKSTGIMVGTINSLPIKEADKDEIFNLAFDDQIKYLENNFQDVDLAKSGFNSKRVGLDSSQLDDVIKHLKQIRQEERALLKLSKATTYALNYNLNEKATLPASKKEFLKILKEINEGKLDFVRDPAELGRRLEKLGEILFQKKSKNHEKLFKRLQGILTRNVETLFKTLKSEKIEVKAGVTLLEMPARMGIFRGCLGGGATGGDCSTRFSFAYPNSPVEREFLVFNKDNKLRGTASATYVEANGKKALYVHTITGKSISPQETQIILDSFYQNKNILGVEEIVLPSKEKVNGLINFINIRGVFEHHIDAAKTTKKLKANLKYYDPQTRKILDESVSIADHDSHTKNTDGILYRPKSKDLKYLESNHQKIKAIDIKLPKLDRESVIFLHLDLEKINQAKSSQRALDTVGMSRGDTRDLREYMYNKKKLPQDRFLGMIRRKFKKLGIKLTEEKLKERLFYFHDGLLDSSDAFDEKNLPRTLKIMREEMALEPDYFDDDYLDIVRKNRTILVEDPAYLKEVKTYLRGDPNEVRGYFTMLEELQIDDLKRSKEILKAFHNKKILPAAYKQNEAAFLNVINKNLDALSKDIDGKILLADLMRPDKTSLKFFNKLNLNLDLKNQMKSIYQYVINPETEIDDAIKKEIDIVYQKFGHSLPKNRNYVHFLKKLYTPHEIPMTDQLLQKLTQADNNELSHYLHDYLANSVEQNQNILEKQADFTKANKAYYQLYKNLHPDISTNLLSPHSLEIRNLQLLTKKLVDLKDPSQKIKIMQQNSPLHKGFGNAYAIIWNNKKPSSMGEAAKQMADLPPTLRNLLFDTLEQDISFEIIPNQAAWRNRRIFEDVYAEDFSKLRKYRDLKIELRNIGVEFSGKSFKEIVPNTFAPIFGQASEDLMIRQKNWKEVYNLSPDKTQFYLDILNRYDNLNRGNTELSKFNQEQKELSEFLIKHLTDIRTKLDKAQKKIFSQKLISLIEKADHTVDRFALLELIDSIYEKGMPKDFSLPLTKQKLYEKLTETFFQKDDPRPLNFEYSTDSKIRKGSTLDHLFRDHRRSLSIDPNGYRVNLFGLELYAEDLEKLKKYVPYMNIETQQKLTKNLFELISLDHLDLDNQMKIFNLYEEITQNLQPDVQKYVLSTNQVKRKKIDFFKTGPLVAEEIIKNIKYFLI